MADDRPDASPRNRSALAAALAAELAPLTRNTGLGRMVLGGVTVLATAATALSAFLTTQVKHLDDRSDQLQDRAGELAGDLDATTDRLTQRTQQRAADLDRLAAALRQLRAENDQDTATLTRASGDAAGRAEAARRDAALAKKKAIAGQRIATEAQRAANAPTASPAPPDPAAALCAFLNLQCQPRKDSP
jgi:DNA anti-recombination protein RmuC